MTGRVALGDAPLLAIDTSTGTAVVAIGDGRSEPLASVTWPARHRHGDALLGRVDEALRAAGIGRSLLGGLVVGTGPGAFTGLRVGIATAKALAHGLRVPLAGIPSGAALLEGARTTGSTDPLALLLPAGPSDAVLVTSAPDGEVTRPVRLPGAVRPPLTARTTVLAVDLEGRAAAAEEALGRRALAALPAALLALGRKRLELRGGDDLAALVPEYVTLPRGVEREAGGVILARS